MWNTFPHRTNVEFRRHLSNLAAHARRDGTRRIILFLDAASYHDTPSVRKFFREHPLFTVKWLPKKDPNTNPTECLVNRRLSSAISVNRPKQDLPSLRAETKKFLRKYNSIYAT